MGADAEDGSLEAVELAIVQPRLRFFTDIWDDGGKDDGEEGDDENGEAAGRTESLLRILQKKFFKWIASPINKLVFAWLLCVIISGALLFMELVEMISFADDHLKGVWDEVNSQLLNALFTLKAAVVHPARILGLYVLLTVRRAPHLTQTHERGSSEAGDIVKNMAFAKTTRSKGSSANVKVKDLGRGLKNRRDAIVFFVLLNINCFAQYVMAFFMWGYRNEQLGGNRPMLGIALALPLSFISEVAAGIWQKCKQRKQEMTPQ